MADYYAVLGIIPGASAEQIRQAFLDLARRVHPDVQPHDATAAARFKDVAEAYEVLSDHHKRRQYDRTLARCAPAARTHPILSTQTSSAEVHAPVRRGKAAPLRQSPVQGPSIILDLPIAPEEAFSGAEVGFNLKLTKDCPACPQRQNVGTCPSCHGTRRVQIVRPAAIRIPRGIRDGTILGLLPPDGGPGEVGVRVKIRACW
jgi:molecular chaperone DnaJ